MTGSNGANAAVQAASFAFDAANAERAKQLVARYPAGRQQSAVIPLLDLAQRQCGGWLPRAALDHVAGILGMPPIRIYEVATFYSMFNLKPVGRHLIQICRTTPCWLRGSDAVTGACRSRLGVEIGESTADGAFTLVEVECLGACVNAPVVQINDDFYEDLDADRMTAVLDALARGEQPPKGSQTGRQGSAPEGDWTTLLTPLPGQAQPGAGETAAVIEMAAAKPKRRRKQSSDDTGTA